jgi:hypothetical protein
MSDEIRIKKIKGNVSDKEQNDTKRIVQENKDLFLKRWNEQKVKIK